MRVSLLALVASICAGCASQPGRPILSDSAVAAAVAGCWELVDGPWRSNKALGKVDPVVRVPQQPVRFELTSAPIPAWDKFQKPNRKLFDVRVDSSTGGRLLTSWSREDATEPRIYISSNSLPMAGLALSLELKGDELVGRITAFTDAPASSWSSGEASAKVAARRIDCAAVRSESTPR